MHSFLTKGNIRSYLSTQVSQLIGYPSKSNSLKIVEMAVQIKLCFAAQAFAKVEEQLTGNQRFNHMNQRAPRSIP